MNKLVGGFLGLVMGLQGAVLASDNHIDFSDVSLGARPAGMGKSFVALANDSNAIYWNPAGLVRVHAHDINVSAFSAFETNYKIIQATTSFSGVSWGLGYLSASMDNIQRVTEFNIEESRWVGSGTYTGYNASALYVSASKGLLPGLSVGITGKYLTEKLDTNSARGFGADLGVLYSPVSGITLGVNAQNILSPAMTWDTPSKSADTTPLALKAGMGLALLNNALSLEADVAMKRGQAMKLMGGAEYWLAPFLPLRAGYDGDVLTFGVGLYVRNLKVDVSWNPHRVVGVEDMYKISLGYRYQLEDLVKR